MRVIIIFFIIIAVIAVFSFLGKFLGGEGNNQDSSQLQEETLSENSQITKPTTNYIGPASVAPIIKPGLIFIDTEITSGPEEGEIIEDTNRVTFEFEAKLFPSQSKERVSFETKIEGFDNDWRKSSSKKRTINLPPGPKEYTFLVRAKTKNSIDLIPASRTFKINTSLYFGKIKISSVQIPTSSRPSLITLRTYLKKEEEISITGWRIKGGTGSSFVIPQGIEKYYSSPFYNPVATDDILVKQGDKVYLSSNSNPLGKGRDFRLNKCLGYLTNYRDFPIPIPKNCLEPTRGEISHLNPCCQEFILRLRSCEIPDYSSNLKISRDSECVSYLNKNFNYNGCFRNYSKDENFLAKNWHIYLNRNTVVNNSCDTLYLRDQNNLFVDKHSYGRPVCR